MGKNWIVTKVNQHYILRSGMRKFKCQVGAGGLKIHTKKREGDKATPIGKWKLKSIYFRSDKMLKPILRTRTIKINKITKNCGWCDDPKSYSYNKYVNIKNFSLKSINFEKLWRKDQAYDMIIETSYNTKPIIKRKGSAIFLHCSFADNRETAGCLALKKNDLVVLVKNLSNKTHLEIKNCF